MKLLQKESKVLIFEEDYITSFQKETNILNFTW